MQLKPFDGPATRIRSCTSFFGIGIDYNGLSIIIEQVRSRFTVRTELCIFVCIKIQFKISHYGISLWLFLNASFTTGNY